MVLKAGSSGYDVLDGSSDADILVGYGYDDVLYGYGGNDYLVGDSGSDPGGDDTLFGGRGNDTLTGGVGDDYIDGCADSIIANYNGGRGVGDFDILRGGAGADTFVLGDEYGSYYENWNGEIGYATIADFNIADDYIQLSGIPENYTFQTVSTGTYISLNNSNGVPSDVIGFVEGVYDLDMSRDCIFVNNFF